MKVAILGGTGVYDIKGLKTVEQSVETDYGTIPVRVGTGKRQNLYFISRHGTDHTIPPHMVNYRGNIHALKKLQVERIFAIYAVGSISHTVSPGGVGLLTQFIDVTQGRFNTFYDGGKAGLKHTPMDEPYCRAMGERILHIATEKGVSIAQSGTYICTNGPRFETPAEIRMYQLWGADYVGMTAATETALIREAGMHFSAVAYAVNWAAGIGGKLAFIGENEMENIKNCLTDIALEVLFARLGPCQCQ